MATFTGTDASEFITPTTVSPTVTTSGPPFPGAENDIIDAGGGSDVVAGGLGNDIASLGAGNDVFLWRPGDGNDTVAGGSGFDRLDFDVTNADELITVTANAGRARLFSEVGGVTLDLDDLERIEIDALFGADRITVGDLTGTEVTQVAIDLEAVADGGATDGQVDRIGVEGTAGADLVALAIVGGAVTINGLAAQVTIEHAEVTDELAIQGRDGNDRIDARALLATSPALKLDGGLGNDVLLGGAGTDIIDGGVGSDVLLGFGGADLLLAGDGSDDVAGGTGDDAAFLGAGNDRFRWVAGDGKDVVEGQSGTDTLAVTGSGVSETIDVFANGWRVLVFRDVAAALDFDDVERIEVDPLGGQDTVTLGDLSGTDVGLVTVDLESAAGSGVGDGQVDRVIANASNAVDVLSLASSGGAIAVDGLAADLRVEHAEAGRDILQLNLLAGDDVLNAVALDNQIDLVVNAGLGKDVVLAGAGNDTVSGGDGDDVAFLGAGNDTFVWNPGDDNDTIRGEAGFDTLQFSGANVAEEITIGAQAGGGAQFLRNIATVRMSLEQVERIDFDARGGADAITIEDMTGTGVTEVAIDLAAIPGTTTGDVAADQVFLRGTGAGDQIVVSAVNGVVRVTGLPATLTVAGAEGGFDRLDIAGLAGNDRIDASGVGTAIGMTLSGGEGNDVLIGSAGNDLLLGGAGNDVYVVTALDLVSESDGGGRDRMVAGFSMALAEDFEDLELSGAGDFAGTGNVFANLVRGNAGANLLTGLAGDDSLRGEAGNDVLVGGAGKDILNGGTGADVFDFDAPSDTPVGPGRDIVVDFLRGTDTIDLSGLDAMAGGQGDQAFTFLGRGLFTGVEGQLRVNASGDVLGDVDGDGLADFAIKVNDGALLTADDFVL